MKNKSESPSSWENDLRPKIKPTSSSGRRLVVILLSVLLVLIGAGAVAAVVYFSQLPQTATPLAEVASATKESAQPINLSALTLPPSHTATTAPSSTATSTATLVALNSSVECKVRASNFAVGGDTASVEIFNDGLSTLTITDLALEWPSEDGQLSEIQFGDSKIAAPNDASSITQLPGEFTWHEGGNRGLAGKAKQTLKFKFTKAAQASGYAVKLKFDRSCELSRTDRITDTPSPTPTKTLTPTRTSTSAPTRTSTRTPSPTRTPKGFVASVTSAKAAATSTPGCSIVLTGFNFSGTIMSLTVSNQEAATITLTRLQVVWGEKELDLIRLGGVLIWNAEDFNSPTIIPDESPWLGPGRDIKPGETLKMEIEFESGNALPGIYHSVDMTFNNGCFRSISN